MEKREIEVVHWSEEKKWNESYCGPCSVCETERTTDEARGDWWDGVKMPNGENYVWVRKHKGLGFSLCVHCITFVTWLRWQRHRPLYRAPSSSGQREARVCVLCIVYACVRACECVCVCVLLEARAECFWWFHQGGLGAKWTVTSGAAAYEGTGRRTHTHTHTHAAMSDSTVGVREGETEGSEVRVDEKCLVLRCHVCFVLWVLQQVRVRGSTTCLRGDTQASLLEILLHS